PILAGRKKARTAEFGHQEGEPSRALAMERYTSQLIVDVEEEYQKRPTGKTKQMSRPNHAVWTGNAKRSTGRRKWKISVKFQIKKIKNSTGNADFKTELIVDVSYGFKRVITRRWKLLLSRNSQGTVDEVKKQIELGLLGSSKGRIQLVVLMNLHLKFRNKERTKEIQDLSQSLDMTNDDSREKQEEPTRQ
ncbi:hypothetical protein PPACK8108_LOCUS13759, partial [Phakopsora pachyrhizi]